MKNDLKLIPVPRSVKCKAGTFAIPAAGVNFGNAKGLSLHVIDIVTEAVQLAGGLVRRDGASAVSFTIADGEKPEWYRLSVTTGGISIEAGSVAGAQHAAVTLRQIVRQGKGDGTIRCCVVEDWPDVARRGIMLDISRDKVPLMKSLFEQVDMMVELKLNEFQLYTEHTFEYSNDGDVWREYSPITADEIRALDSYCKARNIDLVPNQNSFGHLERWLSLPQYKSIAEAPDGFTFRWGAKSTSPFSLNPGDPESIEFIGRLFDELLPNFSSRYFNVGCDETHDVGQGKSKEAVEKLGYGRVYLDFLLKVHAEAKRHGRRMMFWGDMIFHHPELIPEIPGDVIGLVWGYGSEFPFDEQCQKYKSTGLDFYVCPGVATWQSFCGRTDNMIANLRNAAASAVKWGAGGFLNTDWGDHGHHQPAPISWLGYAAGAAVSWAYRRNKELDITDAMDVHIYRDSAGVAGKMMWDLGNAYLVSGDYDCTNIFRAIAFGSERGIAKMNVAKIRKVPAYVRKVMKRAPKMALQRSDASLVQKEIALAADMMIWAVDIAVARSVKGSNGNTPKNWRKYISKDAPKIKDIRRRHREVWLARNRPGGLGESLYKLESFTRPSGMV